MSKDVEALREHLFNTLQALQDEKNPMDTDRARAICQVGTVIIDSAKVEIDFARVNGSVDTSFFARPALTQNAPATKQEEKPTNIEPLRQVPQQNPNVTVQGNVTTHKLR